MAQFLKQKGKGAAGAERISGPAIEIEPAEEADGESAANEPIVKGGNEGYPRIVTDTRGRPFAWFGRVDPAAFGIGENLVKILLAGIAFALVLCGCDQQGDGTPDALQAQDSASPSFDCTKADGKATDLVCKTPMLARMDNELQRLYALAESGTYASDERLEELTAMQRGWIRGRDDCGKADDPLQCVTASYAMRIHEIRQGFFDSRQQDETGITNGPLALACPDAEFGVAVTFVNADPGVAFLQWLDQSVTLVQEQSGSGMKYAGSNHAGKAELFTRGDEATFTPPGGSEMACRIEEIG